MPTALKSTLAYAAWAVVAFLNLIFISAFASWGNSPGAPVPAMWIAGAALILAGIIIFPPVLRRLPAPYRKFGWIFAVAAFFGSVPVSNAANEAYLATPEGKQFAARRQADAWRRAVERAEAAKQQPLPDAREAESRRAVEGAAEALAQARAYEAGVEACFSSWGHRLRSLEDAVRQSLHNPRSFEHVQTVAIVPDAQGFNVAMEFRAENGFGAVRTATVKAKLVPNSCEITEIGSVEV